MHVNVLNFRFFYLKNVVGFKRTLCDGFILRGSVNDLGRFNCGVLDDYFILLGRVMGVQFV